MGLSEVLLLIVVFVMLTSLIQEKERIMNGEALISKSSPSALYLVIMVMLVFISFLIAKSYLCDRILKPRF